MESEKQVAILIIDDEEPVRQSIIAFLEDCGYKMFGAESGRDGLKIFHDKRPDVVLVDLRMPEMDGLEVLETVRYVSPETPIIVVSGMGVIADAVQALRLGAWDYVIKPIQDMNILLHSIGKALERAQLIQANRRYREHLETEVGKRTQELELANSELTEINRRLHEILETKIDLSLFDGFDDCGSQLLKEFGRHMLASGGSLYLREKDGLRLIHSLDPGHAPEFISFPLPEKSLLKKVLETGKPVLFRDIKSKDDLESSGWDGYKDGSVLIFPLPADDGGVEGVLSLHSKTKPPFLEQDKEIGAILASYSSEAMRVSRAKVALKESEETLRAITSSACDAILMLDQSGKVSFWNKAAEEMFGLSRSDAIGRLLQNLIAPERLRVDYEKMLQGCNTPESEEVEKTLIELTAVRKDGTEFQMELSLSPMKLRDKWHTVIVIRDVSLRKH